MIAGHAREPMSPEETYDRVFRIPGWFDLDDIKGFASLEMPKRPVVVECGTYCGRSSAAFALLWPEATIWTCDPAEEDARVIVPGVRFFPGTGLEMPIPESIDLLFIDDSHFYEDTKANFERFSPALKTGGYAVFHDYCFETDAVDGVRRFVNELGGFEVWPGRYGLAIYKKP